MVFLLEGIGSACWNRIQIGIYSIRNDSNISIAIFNFKFCLSFDFNTYLICN